MAALRFWLPVIAIVLFVRTLLFQPFHIPSGSIKEGIARGRKRGEIRHRGTGDQATRTILRQSQGFANPPKNDIFQFRGDRGHHSQRRILVPRTSQPIGRQRRRNHPSVHEAEIAPASCGYAGWGAKFVERCDHVAWIARRVRKRFLKSIKRSHGGF